VSIFDDETRKTWCFKVTNKRTTKFFKQSHIKMIAEHQYSPANRKDWVKTRRFMEAHIYKEKILTGFQDDT